MHRIYKYLASVVYTKRTLENNELCSLMAPKAMMRKKTDIEPKQCFCCSATINQACRLHRVVVTYTENLTPIQGELIHGVELPLTGITDALLISGNWQIDISFSPTTRLTYRCPATGGAQVNEHNSLFFCEHFAIDILKVNIKLWILRDWMLIHAYHLFVLLKRHARCRYNGPEVFLMNY